MNLTQPNTIDTQAIQDALAGLVAVLTNLMQAVIEALRPLVTRLCDSLYQDYLQAGAPYGREQKGMSRWYRLLAAKAHKRFCLAAARLHQWAVAPIIQALAVAVGKDQPKAP